MRNIVERLLSYIVENFNAYLKKKLPYRRSFNEEWMNNFVGPKCVVYYDKLKTDLTGEMRRLMKFLDHVQYKDKEVIKNCKVEKKRQYNVHKKERQRGKQ
jgi:hypothetical protein